MLAALTASIVLTLHSPAKIKGWVNDSGIYTNVVDAALSQAQKSAKNSGDELPIKNPGVQKAAKNAFSPKVLQKDTENVIDGTYHWLQGKSPQPDFKIDLSGPKKNFANGIGDYLRQRAKTLPACTFGQIPTSTDVFKINCIPPGFDTNATIQQQVDKLANSKDFLGDPVITAKTLKASKNGDPLADQIELVGEPVPFFENDKVKLVPKAYQKATWSPWLVGGLALLGVVIIIFLHDERRRSMKRVARIVLPMGVLLIFTGIAVMQIAKRGEAQIHLKGEGVSQLQPAVIKLINSVTGSLAHVYIWFGVAYALFGISLLVAVKLWMKPVKPTETEKPSESDKKPEKPTDTEPAQKTKSP